MEFVGLEFFSHLIHKTRTQHQDALGVTDAE
jgi:hypothetical protein